MPKSTFNNLSEEKKKRIFDARGAGVFHPAFQRGIHQPVHFAYAVIK